MSHPNTGAAAAPPRGYRPIRLTLIGFKGIRSGLGRDSITLDFGNLPDEAALVAIAGANGRGKTTLIENFHPYLVMPSRAGADGLGAFSFHDHVFLPESQKDLVWEHRGRRYRSQLVFRLNGKRRTEAFLFEQHGEAWRPAVMADGSACDGKVETYEHAVREVLGSPETFFTSVFSAQGRRQLSAYRNGEIKSLLADLLGLDEVRSQGQRAAETASLLKNGLALVRQEQAGLAQATGRLEAEAASLGPADGALQQAVAAKARAAQALEQARTNEGTLKVQAQAVEASERRRRELLAERGRVQADAAAARQRLDEDGCRLDARTNSLQQRQAARQRQHVERRSALLRQRDEQRQRCAVAPRVLWATRRLPLAERAADARTERAAQARATADHAGQLRNRERMLRQEFAAIEREAGQLALRQADLERRFGLTAQVPCAAGTDLQGRCMLLGDAHQAQALKPSVDAQIASLAARKQGAAQELTAVLGRLALLTGAEQRRDDADRRLARAQERAAVLARLAAREGEIRQARSLLESTERELAAMGEAVPPQTPEEAAELAECAQGRQALQAEWGRVDAMRDEALARIDQANAALPPAFDPRRLEAGRRMVEQAGAALREAEQADLAAVRRQERHAALQCQLEETRSNASTADSRAAAIERELGGWLLLARCLSNDGVIALDIDDAGPTLSGLTNDLLLACHGRRFTVEIRTLVTTARGEAREGFDILVHDAETGEAKSVSLMSGGERVFVDACLTRAIALYLAQDAGRSYGTLFSDEADGPLDSDRKRMFMDMKRAVLRLGGYEREFFVSQTPELTAMADHIVDLDALVVSAEVAV